MNIVLNKYIFIYIVCIQHNYKFNNKFSCNILQSTFDNSNLDNKQEVEDPQIELCTITSKKGTLVLETLRKSIEGNKGVKDVFKTIGCLENRIENNVLNK